MNKKMIAMTLAFLLIFTNASLVSALSPVAEIYYNTTGASVHSSDFEAQLNDAIKTKLIAGGVDPKYVKIMDASANPTVTDSTYVHSGRDSWYNGSTPMVETADYNHVQIFNEGKTFTFYGYTAPAYKDFMLTSDSPSGKKIISFDMDESKVDYHSMEGGGFLFNATIDSDDKLSGYAILYISGAIKVYKIAGVSVSALHNERSNALRAMQGVSEVGTFTKGSATKHSIKINATDSQLNMWDNGVQIIKDLALPTVYGNNFGPLVSHVSHGCGIISIFSFDNMKLYTTSPKTLNEAVAEIPWEPNSPLRYVVDLNEDPASSLDGGTNQADLTNSFNNSGAQYIGVTESVYKTASDSFIGTINGGLHVDSSKTSAQVIDEIASRVATKVINDYKAAITNMLEAENKTDLTFSAGDDKNSVTKKITLKQDDDATATTVWSSDQPSIIAPDGTVTRPAIAQAGTYVTLKATITKGGLTSEKTFTVYVKAAAPAPLATLAVTAGNGQAVLNFPALNGATNIVVQQSTNGTNFTAVPSVETLTAASTSATITGLTNGTTYYYRLVVTSGYYNGTSNVVTATPSAPVTTLTAEAGSEQVTLKFPALTGASSIVVQKSTDGITFTPAATTAQLNATSTSATVTGLTNDTTYYFRLSVVSGENAGLSNVVTATLVAPLVYPQPTMKTEVIISDPTNGGKATEEKITSLIGENLKVTGKITSATGQELNLPSIVMNPDGTFTLPQVSPGQYKLAMNVIAPNGEKLAGPEGTLVVDSNGKASLSIELVDPYGTILDTVTGQPVAGVKMTLYWADTPLNRSKGRVPGTPVQLPELPDFPPNQNHNPQISSETGEYGWMVYADGDYYFLGEKEGYTVFDSRKDTREEKFGEDSYIKDGIIHVGETIVKFSFSQQPKVEEAGDHTPYIVGYPDGSFQPERGISRAEVAAILSRLYTSSAGSSKASYADVNAKDWAAKAIAGATGNKWMVGFGDDTFKPDKKITRAEFAQILTNVYKWDAATESSYTDVTGHWAAKAIATVEEQGLLFDFKEKTFNPNKPITRVEAVRIFNQLLDRKPWHIEIAPKWSDVPASHKYYKDIMEASTPHPFELYETGVESWK